MKNDCRMSFFQSVLRLQVLISQSLSKVCFGKNTEHADAYRFFAGS